MQKFITSLILLTLSISVSACSIFNVGGTGSAVTGFLEKRSIGRAIDDSVIWSELNEKFQDEENYKKYSDIKTEVIEGRVHLNGETPDNETRVNAVKLAWQIDGVKEVTNDIHLASELNETIGSIAKDHWIGTELRTRLLFAKNVSFMDYSIEVYDHTVYLMGIAEDESELNKVTKIASQIDGVKQVVSYVRLKNEIR